MIRHFVNDQGRLHPLLAGSFIAALAGGLAGCNGNDDEGAAAQPLTCAQMAQVTVAPGVMALPTKGAIITSATQVDAAGTGSTAVGSFCRVRAEIASVDPAAPPIKLEVNLPDTWNGKALMYGGGGYNGTILSTAGTIRLQPADQPIPLGRGYATFGSDSGHSGSSSDGSFAANDEALRNYAYEALKKTRDAAGYLIGQRYGRAAEKVYFHGSSNGGKEGLAMVQKYPNDIDGVMLFWPATMLGTAELQFARIARAWTQPGAGVNVAKRQLLFAAGVSACDGLDGVQDGLVSNSRACQLAFDPATAIFNGRPLRCPSGADEGDTCLSDAQIQSLKTMATPITLNYALGSGETQYPGFNVWGTDLGTKTSDALGNGVTTQGLGTVAPAYPATAGMAFMLPFSEQYMKFFVARDANASWQSVDPQNPGLLQSRLATLAGLLDMSQTDLSAFQARGGKVLMVHGMSDQLVPPKASEQYFDRVTAAMGAQKVQSFFKFYEIPGVSHGGNGIAFTPTYDVLGALDDWATKGTAPVLPVATDTYAHPGRTRPLCEYPTFPKYVGGDVEKAASFTCGQ